MENCGKQDDPIPARACRPTTTTVFPKSKIENEVHSNSIRTNQRTENIICRSATNCHQKNTGNECINVGCKELTGLDPSIRTKANDYFATMRLNGSIEIHEKTMDSNCGSSVFNNSRVNGEDNYPVNSLAGQFQEKCSLESSHSQLGSSNKMTKVLPILNGCTYSCGQMPNVCLCSLSKNIATDSSLCSSPKCASKCASLNPPASAAASLSHCAASGSGNSLKSNGYDYQGGLSLTAAHNDTPEYWRQQLSQISRDCATASPTTTNQCNEASSPNWRDIKRTSFELQQTLDSIVYVGYESEKQMPDIMRLIQKDLSEPYSVYTYRYFIHNWPHLCFLAFGEDKCVGAVVCKLDMHKKSIRRGYIAMLAVDENYRKKRIGSNLVLKAIQAMIADDADEVVLETEITNKPALQLYENLGFVRDKRLFRYYLNGVDALRLKLWLR